MPYNTIHYSVQDRILTLMLNRPENLNAFTVEMANELVHAFNRASNDEDVGAVVVTGAGRAFCAGMDLSVEGNVFGLDEGQTPTLDDLHKRFDYPSIVEGVRDTGGRVALAIYDCNKPVIGAINGAAVGVGATMTLAMDVRYASEKARMGFVFAKLGITMEACSSWFLPRIVGMGKAMELIYSARIINGEQMARIGLANEVCSAEDLLPTAMGLARELATRSPVSTALMRHMLYRMSAADHPVEAHRVDSLSMFYTSIGDGKEGVTAFLEKRDPEFSGNTAKMPPFFPWWE
ncbi:MAG: crotonase/enoyl-CoA hydratase family protein [Pseudomonadales bacterium]|jgi:enoyl-CoA hydratase/carnithine racemase|nr:crotonase/enoyl-CoA hydratase family protein [Pseudomonadales bacterium]MDP6472390.1 crotonase/enoyl-CoA hydratase family protein [Pseudomonadales bacterium]MDP6828186.1 crotonase/enoyl-CoA hydratase family protein [Pseudomonadales bacterium]MDP6970264.1 crotonase/enoyl-CoA hydratase family protein [Pseudomonadales bacterium]|tara:strand:- start:183 stop:1055 length:873 start_codon:yes stop_codon:yes gene_type:complete